MFAVKCDKCKGEIGEGEYAITVNWYHLGFTADRWRAEFPPYESIYRTKIYCSIQCFAESTELLEWAKMNKVNKEEERRND